MLFYQKPLKQEKERLAASFKPENFIPGLIIGFVCGMLMDLAKPAINHAKKKNFLPGKPEPQCLVSNKSDLELKMVCLNLFKFQL